MAEEALDENLHGRDLHSERTRSHDVFMPGGDQPSDEKLAAFQQTENWEGSPSFTQGDLIIAPGTVVPGSRRELWRKGIIFFLGGMACILLVVGVIIKLYTVPFSENKIALALSGPNDVASAESVTFTFDYTNSNKNVLKKSSVVFEYPENFHPESVPGLSLNASRAELVIGDIAALGSGKVTLTGKFYASKGDHFVLSATLRYTPDTTTNVFEKKIEHPVTVGSSPISFEIAAPLELASDQEVQYDISFTNTGDIAFANLKVKLEYPAGFTFTAAEPKPIDGNTLWAVGNLAPHESGSITVRGRISGARDEQKTVHGSIGFFQGDENFAAYADNERKVRIVASPFIITQTVNGHPDSVINPGETLHYEIVYKNEGNVGARDAIVMVEVDSPYVDLASLQFTSREGKGAYSQALKAIVWKAADVPALGRIEAGQEGRIGFSVGTYTDVVKRAIETAKNPSIRTVARIDSPDIRAIVGVTKVVASNVLTTKLNTAVTGSLQGFYQDALFPNNGPLPPVVGQETTYTMHLKLSTSTNVVNDGRVSILLPTGIRYTGKEGPVDEKVTWNERTNELMWDIGSLSPDKAREIVFQIGLTPDPSSVGLEPTLVSQAVFTGTDSFTGQQNELRMDKKTTQLGENSAAGKDNSHVQAVTP